MILELFLDNMATDFSNQVVIVDQIENKLKAGKTQNATTISLSVYPQEQYFLPN